MKHPSEDVVLCHPLRTPVGAYLGSLAALDAAALATHVVREIAQRSGLGDLAASVVDDVILGNCNPSGEFPALGRVVALDAALGVGVPGMQIDRRCGSGLQAILSAANQIRVGEANVIIAGGAESMSRVEHYALLRQGVRGDATSLVDRLAQARAKASGASHPIPGGMIETAENLRREYGISRAEQDEFALASHQKAARAQREGRFTDELLPIEVPGRRGTVNVVDTDEHVRPDTSLEALARLRPILGRSDPEATVTAGNASGQNDAAAACIVTTRAEAERRGWEPMLVLRSAGVAGVAPEYMGIGPVAASQKALERAGLSLADMDLIELNEAFAAQALAVLREWGIPATDERLNPNGSAISLGHPVGATGARIAVTAAHELRRSGGRYLLETMCIGGGQGLAAVFERAEA